MQQGLKSLRKFSSPFGVTLSNRDFTSESYRYGFNGQEKDDEVKGSGNSYDFGFRMYDPRIGRWLSIDKVPKFWESPYAWNTNNPIRFIDEMGLDSAERATAVTKANEYVSKNTYFQTGVTTYSQTNGRGGEGDPGQTVDCQGLVEGCIKAAGYPDPDYNSTTAKGMVGQGVAQIVNASTEVTLEQLQEGNAVTMNTGTKYGDWSHIGIVSKIYRDESGNITSFDIVHSASKTGPQTLNIKKDANGEFKAWGTYKLTGFWKWDSEEGATGLTKPQIQKAEAEGVKAATDFIKDLDNQKYDNPEFIKKLNERLLKEALKDDK